jgi:anti-sigma factor RsiW
MNDTANFSPRELADLSALADGSLDPARRAAVQEWVDASPERTAMYERERRAVTVLQATRADRAPAALRARIEAQRKERSAPLVRWRLAYGGGLAGALAAIGLALALILPAGTPGAPSISQAAALAVRGATAPAPGPAPHERSGLLNTNVGSLYFPNWTQRYGWQATGERRDHINGRVADTVYYRSHGQTIAYTIVQAPALEIPKSTHSRLHGADLWTLNMGGRQIVTWRKEGHTCVLSSKPGVSVSELRTLAAAEASGIDAD